MTSKHEGFVALNNRINLSRERFCRTSDGKKLAIWIDSHNKVFRIICDGKMVDVPFEVATWLPSTMTQLYKRGRECSVIEEWWLCSEDDEE